MIISFYWSAVRTCTGTEFIGDVLHSVLNLIRVNRVMLSLKVLCEITSWIKWFSVWFDWVRKSQNWLALDIYLNLEHLFTIIEQEMYSLQFFRSEEDLVYSHDIDSTMNESGIGYKKEN